MEQNPSDRKQFTFYMSFFQSIQRIRNKAARADAYDTLCAYALMGQEPDMDKLSDPAAMAFIAARPVLDASRRKAEGGRNKKKKDTSNITERCCEDAAKTE